MFRRAWRRLAATPVFTIFAAVSLALGVGVTTAIYSVVASLADMGLDVAHDDRLALVVGSDPFDARRLTWRSAISRADFREMSEASAAIRHAAVSARFWQSLVAPSVSEVISGEAVSGNYFTKLELVPYLGRLIQPSDDVTPGRIAVIGHQFWRTRFGAAPDVVGRTVRMGGEPFEIVGVAPEHFGGLTDRIQAYTAVWVPLGSTTMFASNAAPPEDPSDRRRRQLSVLLTLSGEATPETVSAEVRAIGERLDREYPIDMRTDPDASSRRIARSWSVRSVADIRDGADGAMARAEAIVMAIVGLVLVVACTNLANLVLARASARQHELAVRRALGASRGRLVLEELAETGLLAAMGVVGAFIVTRALLWWFASASLPISEAVVVQLDPEVNLSTLGVAGLSVLASLVVFGLGPALQVTRVALRPALATDGGATGQLRWRARRRLIALQVAISLSFFLIAAFAVRIALGERLRPSGIDVNRLAIGLVNFRLPSWDEARARRAIEGLTSIVPSAYGFETLAVSSGMPFGTTYTPLAEMTRVDQPFLPGRDEYPYAPLLAASPSIFRTLGVAIVRGRAFDDRDRPGGPDVAVISELAARQVFGTVDVVGREFLLRNELNMADRTTVKTLTVIGVAADTDADRRYSRHAGIVYLPIAQHYEPTLALVGRTSGDPAALAPALKSVAQAVDPDLVVDRPTSAALALTGAYVLVGIVSRVAGGLALLAMVLAMAGLFGVLSHLVAKRTREMGLRMALGADAGRIRRLVIADGLRPVLVGVGLGWVIGVVARLLLRAAYSSPLSANDVLVFGVAPIPIILSALIACYWPARRAAKVDPNVALREL